MWLLNYDYVDFIYQYWQIVMRSWYFDVWKNLKYYTFKMFCNYGNIHPISSNSLILITHKRWSKKQTSYRGIYFLPNMLHGNNIRLYILEQLQNNRIRIQPFRTTGSRSNPSKKPDRYQTLQNNRIWIQPFRPTASGINPSEQTDLD